MNQLKTAGASNTLFAHERPNNPRRSRFDLSRITNFTVDAGMIVPFDWFEVLPGDDVSIDTEQIVDTLPLVQSSLTGYRVTIHWYYMKCRDMWKGFKTMVTKGRSGNVSLTVPTVDLSHKLSSAVKRKPFTDDTDEFNGYVLPRGSHSLGAFLGVPSTVNGEYTGLKSESSDVDNPYAWSIDKAYLPYVWLPNADTAIRSSYRDICQTGFGDFSTPSALPFVMYQAVVKHNYVNQNLLQGNAALFPEEGDDDWILPYSATTVNYIGRGETDNLSAVLDGSDTDWKWSYDGVFSNTDTRVRLDLLRYAQFDDDYFTTGLPWLQRGDVTTLEADVSEISALITGSGNVGSSDDSFIRSTYNPNIGWSTNSGKIGREGSGGSWVDSPTNGASGYRLYPEISASAIASKLSVTVGGSGRVSLTANQLRELIALSVWQERNARVDGSYNNMIFQHWKVNPRSEEHKPVYIGGSADYINFSTVIQNSSSTSDSPLGSTAGFGSSGGSANVGNFHCDDYGYVMGIMIIKPNSTYQQGVEHALCCENVFEDFVQPEFEGLSPEPIKNIELYVSGDSSADDDMFCYQERYTYLKVRQNVNRGLFQCKPEKDKLFGAFTQARWFDDTPKLSYQFLCMAPFNLRRDWLAYPSYPAFRVQLASKVFVTRSLAYTSEPNTFGF